MHVRELALLPTVRQLAGPVLNASHHHLKIVDDALDGLIL